MRLTYADLRPGDLIVYVYPEDGRRIDCEFQAWIILGLGDVDHFNHRKFRILYTLSTRLGKWTSLREESWSIDSVLPEPEPGDGKARVFVIC